MTDVNAGSSMMDQNKDTGAPKRAALGRGLAALIPGAAPTTPAPAGLRALPIERVHPNRSQPRKHFEADALAELVESVKTRGVLQPIIVRRLGDGYEIVAGERRWRAAQQAGLHEIPAVIKELADTDVLQVALIENVQRQDLDPLEEAEAYQRLIREHQLTQDEVAAAVGKKRTTVTNALRLLNLPEPVLHMLADGRLTAGHARALMQLAEPKAMQKLADEIVARKLSVRDAEQRARLAKKPTAAKAAEGATSPAEVAVQERLQRKLATKIRLHHRQGKGRIEIFFHSLDELDRLLDAIAP
ncbi:MAG: ParB/RepB/Spo0J family partition protein [Myxococcota bacterium]